MAEIRSAKQATEIAVNFLKRYRVLVVPVSAVRHEDLWEVKVDVGPFATRIATIHIRARTGEITDYTIPTEGGKE